MARPPVRNFVNLATGIEHLPSLLQAEPGRAEVKFCRLQSTALEQGHWGDFLRDAGADLVTCLALGYECRIYDCGSRSGQESRVIWQGVPWLRFALGAAWKTPERGESVVRGMDARTQFGMQYSELPERVKTWMKYFRPFVRTRRVYLYGVPMTSLLDGQYDRLAEILWKEM